MRIMMRGGRSTALVAAVACAVLVTVCEPRPQNRQKRSGIVDQRIAELESMLSRTRGKSMPVAAGLFDPDRIGKRKRSRDQYPFDIIDNDETDYVVAEDDNEPPTEETLRRIRQWLQSHRRLD